jgi:heme exporter protein A
VAALISADNLAVFRGDKLLFRQLSLSLDEGQMLQLLGANGSGKTTLLRALCSLVALEAGEIRWRGQPLAKVRDQYFAEILYAGHSDGLNGDMTPRENLVFGARLRGSDTDRVDAAIERVGLRRQAELPCRALSAGQRRRVGLARLLVSEAVLWLLDEPLTALDVAGRELVESLLADQVSAGRSVIFTTHQPLQVHDCELQTLTVA